MRIAPVPARGIPGAMHAEAVTLARCQTRNVSMPAKRAGLGKIDSLLVALIIEKTKLDALGDFRKDREVDAGAVVGGTQRVPMSRPNVGGCWRTFHRFGRFGHTYTANPNLGISFPSPALGTAASKRLATGFAFPFHVPGAASFDEPPFSTRENIELTN